MKKRFVSFCTAAALAVSLLALPVSASEAQEVSAYSEAGSDEIDEPAGDEGNGEEVSVSEENTGDPEYSDETAGDTGNSDAADEETENSEEAGEVPGETVGDPLDASDLTDNEIPDDITGESPDETSVNAEEPAAGEEILEEEDSDEEDEDEEEEEDEEIALLDSTTVASGSCGSSATWTLDTQGVLTIKGSGAMENYSSYTASPWYSYRSDITSIVISSGITTVGKYAFAYTKAASVTIPKGVTQINEGAFYGCSSLTSVSIPDSVTEIDQGAFCNCTSLSSITLGSNLATVKDYAFQNTAITKLSLPASVSSFSSLSCYGCSKLSSISVASGNSTYASSNGVLFNAGKTKLILYPLGKTDSSYSIPSTVKTIGENAFYQNKYITSVTIPSSVTSIEDWAFASCTALTSITIPDSVTSLGTGIADSCTALKTAVVGSGVSVLSYRTFYGCTALTTVTLKKGLKEIYNWAFYNCTSLSSITLPSGLESIDTNAFYSCTSLKSITIPSSVTYIDAYAFYKCDNLKITYPSDLTKMDDGSYRAVETVKLTGTCNYNYAYQVLDLVNQERAAQGLSSLTMDADLLDAAMQRAAELTVNFSHTRPSGLSCFTVSSKASAENIAAGQSSASAVMNSWMNSSGHKANILGSSYKSIGIGCFTQGGTLYWVQLFGTGSATSVSKSGTSSKTYSASLDLDTFEGTLSLSPSSTSVKVGSSTTLTARIHNPGWSSAYATIDASSLKWSSSSSKATVNSSGKVTGKAAGNATITAKTANGKLSATAKVETTSASLVEGYLSRSSNGTYYFYVNGVKQSSYTGFASAGGSKWYVENGAVTMKKNGVLKDTKGAVGSSGTWYYVVGSEVQTGFTGLSHYKNSSGWWYITKGKVDRSYTGLAKNQNGWFYVKNGKVDRSYTGFAKNSSGKWYVSGGKVTKAKNGVLKDSKGAIGAKNTWYYVVGSKVQTSFTGLANYSNSSGWWYITKGKVDRSYNGLAKNKNGWFYLKNGKVDRSYTGLAKNSKGTWYVKKGKVQKSYTGTVTLNGKKYSVTNGKVKV